MTDTLTLVDRVNDRVDAALEYETTHCDAGENYTYSVGEGWVDQDKARAFLDGWFNRFSHTLDEDVAGQLRSMPLVTLGELLWDIWQDQGFMESGFIFSGDAHDSVILDCFPVGEIEVDISDLVETASERELEGLSECDAYVKGALAYQSTDVVWLAVIPAAAVIEAAKYHG